MDNLSWQRHKILLNLFFVFCLNSIASGVESNEVILYEDPGFSGHSSNFTLEPGMRQYSYEYFDMYTSSIEVGSDVNVAVFRHLGFCGPSKVFENTLGYVGNYWNDEIKSFIIFPKDQPAPFGVKMSDTAPNTVTGYEPVSQFFPAPKYLATDWDESYSNFFLNLFYDGPEYEYVLIQGDNVEAELFSEPNFEGYSLILPPKTNVCSDDAEREFNGYRYYRLSGCVLKHVACLKVRWINSDALPKERSSAVGTSTSEFISEPDSEQITAPTGSAPRIVDVLWKPNIKAIEVTFDQFPADLWSHQWEMYIDNVSLPVEAPAGYPNVRPNAALDQNPTGVLIGDLPWLSSLDATDLPCCGTIKFCIPGIGCTNEMEFNLAGEGCRTASSKNCGSGQESPTQQEPPEGSSDVIAGLAVGISEIPTDSSLLSSTGIELEYNVDRPGMNLMQGYVLSSPDPWLCANDCFHNPDCKAFTYVKPGFRYPDSPCECWLKNGVPDPVPQEYCISGIK